MERETSKNEKKLECSNPISEKEEKYFFRKNRFELILSVIQFLQIFSTSFEFEVKTSIARHHKRLMYCIDNVSVLYLIFLDRCCSKCT
jgi:hypothetical protein